MILPFMMKILKNIYANSFLGCRRDLESQQDQELRFQHCRVQILVHFNLDLTVGLCH